MLIDELIAVVEKAKGCTCSTESYICNSCKNYISPEKREEMYDDILMRLKQEKWVIDEMEEMRVEEEN